jgi:hypothetical protein
MAIATNTEVVNLIRAVLGLGPLPSTEAPNTQEPIDTGMLALELWQSCPTRHAGTERGNAFHESKSLYRAHAAQRRNGRMRL